ncbi:MAG: TetR/AcrR family transcriptional regulator [Acidimicrobiia bacterium]|nr:TetR/AcrR family transcriptional regulator [Acidimicrobiia bacterium]MBV9039943.1 TetR/AcrR family transcriptional regulator [Acidimicrobiia bacterium]
MTDASWREQAVERSLDSARVRAESRVQRFIDAAFELLVDSEPGKDFTVQDVVEKSGQSLRSFYQYFGGKQELLLALFEESVRSTAEQLRARIEGEKDPLERLHRFVIEYYAQCRPSRSKGKKKTPIALAEFAQQLMTAHPEEATHAFAPIVELFDEVLDAAVSAGAVRGDLSGRRIAGVVLEVIMFNAFSATIGGAARGAGRGDPAEELWDLLVNGIGA